MPSRHSRLARALRLAAALGAAALCLACTEVEREAEREPELLPAVRAPAPPPTSPHLVLVSVDTLRRDHLSVYGYPRPTSPHLERVAREGVLFENAFAACTQTAPSHASILTGLYPGQHGIERNAMRLREGTPTLAQELRSRGYATAAFASSWTLARATGLDAGFDVYDWSSGKGRARRAEETWPLARRWLREQAAAGHPFFLFLHFYDPHSPYDPPKGWAPRFLPDGARLRPWRLKELREPERAARIDAATAASYVARYDGEIAWADHHLGLLLAELEALGILEHTLLVFTSDHGETLFERPRPADHGDRVYDEQLRIPLVMRFPRAEHAGRRIAGAVHHVDVLPTLADGLGLPAPRASGGRSLLPWIRGPEGSVERPMFSQASSKPERMRQLPVRLAKDRLVHGLRLPGHKLIEYPLEEGVYLELFDLARDPGETRNLAEAERERAAQLHALLSRWRAQTGASGGEALPAPSPEAEEALRALGYLD